MWQIYWTYHFLKIARKVKGNREDGISVRYLPSHALSPNMALYSTSGHIKVMVRVRARVRVRASSILRLAD